MVQLPWALLLSRTAFYERHCSEGAVCSGRLRYSCSKDMASAVIRSWSTLQFSRFPSAFSLGWTDIRTVYIATAKPTNIMPAVHQVPNIHFGLPYFTELPAKAPHVPLNKQPRCLSGGQELLKEGCSSSQRLEITSNVQHNQVVPVNQTVQNACP